MSLDTDKTQEATVTFWISSITSSVDVHFFFVMDLKPVVLCVSNLPHRFFLDNLDGVLEAYFVGSLPSLHRFRSPYPEASSFKFPKVNDAAISLGNWQTTALVVPATSPLQRISAKSSYAEIFLSAHRF
ncbi:hypothetical protein V3C99_009533 [Haemonchus contortus]